MIINPICIPKDYPESYFDPSSLIVQAKKVLSFLNPASKGGSAFSILRVGANVYVYLRDPSASPPFEGKRVREIKKELLLFAREKMRLAPLFRGAAQTLLVVECYKNLYNLIAKSSLKELFPHAKVVVSLSTFFLSAIEFLKKYDDWKHSENADQESENLMKATKAFATAAVEVCQLALFLSACPGALPLQLALSTLLYGITLYEIFLKETEEPFDLKGSVETPPEITIRI